MNYTGRIIIGLVVIVIFSAFSKSPLSEKVKVLPSESSVTIKNDINIENSTNTTTSTSKTDIVIECDGVKKEYHSDKAENVNLNCDDSTTGSVKNTVNITNEKSPTSTITTNPTQTEKIKDTQKKIDEKKKEIQNDVKSAKDEIEKKKMTMLEKIKEILENAFKFLHF